MISNENENLKSTKDEFFEEKNSLRRFLVGIIATTFGVLVALHPSFFAYQSGRWCYVISIIFNAISLFFFIGSLFGRYFMLKEKWANQYERFKSEMQGEKYKPIEYKVSKIFYTCSILGLLFYLLAIVVACIFIVLEVLG